MYSTKICGRSSKLALIISLPLLTLMDFAGWKNCLTASANPPALQFSVASIAYVPRKDHLKQVALSRAVTQKISAAYGNRTPLLNEVIRLVPDAYPPQARVLGVWQQTYDSRGQKLKYRSHFVINLNRAFKNPTFWRSIDRQNVEVAFHALARNVAFQNEPKGRALPIQFVVEGKPIDRIGGFNTRALFPKSILKAS